MRMPAKVPTPVAGGKRDVAISLSPERDGWTVGPALRGAGTALDAETQATFSSKFGFSFANVRIHADPVAARAASTLGARAFTIGREIYFGAEQFQPRSTEGRRLLAHELTHVVQQKAAPLPAGGAPIRPATAADERRAALTGAEADHALPFTSLGASGPALAMQQAPQAPGSSAAERVVAALNQPDPVAGVGDPNAALEILRSLGTDELIATLIAVDDQYLLDVLISAIGSNDQTPVGTAIYAVRFTSPHGTPGDQFGVQAARGIAQLPQADQDAIIARVLARRGAGMTVQQVREGLEALLESEAALDVAGEEEVDDLAAPVVPPVAGMVMGPWNPGRMPVPFYIGNSAHLAIAAEYAALHRSDAAFYNFQPISAILDAARIMGIVVNPLALRAAQLGLRPDIANITRRHLYEIKPAASQGLARAEALVYAAAFTAAGLPLALGPVNEPGTSGTVPAPGGWYTFTSPEPGVITYRYRQPRRRRVRAPQQSTSPAVSQSFMQQMQALTGLTGTALIIYIFISEGSRILVPPRNLIPVP